MVFCMYTLMHFFISGYNYPVFLCCSLLLCEITYSYSFEYVCLALVPHWLMPQLTCSHFWLVPLVDSCPHWFVSHIDFPPTSFSLHIYALVYPLAPTLLLISLLSFFYPFNLSTPADPGSCLLQGSREFVRAVADYITREKTLLTFKKGDIIRVTGSERHGDNGRSHITQSCFVQACPSVLVHLPVGKKNWVIF